jgi:hypothetical protein
VIMSLAYGGNTVIFSPRYGYAIPEDRVRNEYKSVNGDLIINEIANDALYEIPLNAISKHDYDHIYAFWDGMFKCVFTPDTSAPGTTITVRIINESDPLTMMQGTLWASFYEGILILREVPALS